MKLYVNIQGNNVIDVTDLENQDFKMISVKTFDDAIEYFENQTLQVEANAQEKLEEIFGDVQENVLGVYDIKVSTENRSFNELADMFQEGEIKVPSMQRNFVWSTSKCSKLIESILIGLPIPPLFFMDQGNNQYEVIDGLQRLTAISNFILGNNWGSITNEVHRASTAKLSTNVDASISGKTFEGLSNEQQKKLKRSTITVIDFRQINAKDEKAKYLIFERINTGSELLNPMQIRKALAYGKFMESLYKCANESQVLKSIFGKQYLNKDRHVEFLLGVYSTYKTLNKEYKLNSQYQKYILNHFCEDQKESQISSDFMKKFDEKLKNLVEVFSVKNIFRKVTKDGEYIGNRNNNISEVLLATMIMEDSIAVDLNVKKYKKEIYNNIDKFNVNTVTEQLLHSRNDICKNILEV